MQRKPNKVRAKLQKGEVVTGSVLYSWNPNVLEAIGYAGLDFIRLDTEHTWHQSESMEHLMRAAYIADIVPIVRVDRDNPYLIRKALEIGAGGIIVPEVNTPEEAAEIVKAAKYPPRGHKGYSGQVWAGSWGTQAGEPFINWMDTEPMIGIMIEHKDAISNVDEILAVDGIDFAHFGPADLSMSYGLGKPDRNNALIQEACIKTIEAAKKSGKYVLYNPGLNTEEIEKYLKMGITMVELSNDLASMRTTLGKAKDTVLNLAKKI
jgi:4-hydroxy-2-oxoheptanedioate aldolase